MTIGDNGGPPLDDPNYAYHLFLWKKARKELKKVSIESVRSRMKDAEKEGLTYDEYCVKYRLHKELSLI
jgi:hypothetical protein